MDFRKVKSILLVVLLIMDLIMGVYLVYIKQHDYELNKSTRTQVAELLQKNKVSLDEKLLSVKRTSMRSCYVTRVVEGDTEFLKKLLGGKYTKGEGGKYISGTKQMVIEGDVFHFTDSKPSVSLVSLDSQIVEAYCRKNMEKLGIDTGIYVFDGLNSAGNNVKAIFSPQYDGIEFFDSYISFELSKSGITSILAKNLITSVDISGRPSTLFGINSVLLDAVSNPALSKSKITSIISIDSGYYIGYNYNDYRHVLAIPTWQIAADSGDILYYDARNGSYIEQ